MKVAVSGYAGFLGWHFRCAFLARFSQDVVLIDRALFDDVDKLALRLANTDVLIHFAGVNRHSDESYLERENVRLAETLVQAIKKTDRDMFVVYANSIQSGNNSAFGRSKEKAAEIFEAGLPGAFANVLLPNIFGEHGRPHYNSFVATFCAEIANGHAPSVIENCEVSLLHAQDAVEQVIELACQRQVGNFSPEGSPKLVSSVLGALELMADGYRTGQIPDLSDKFTRDLFNTYRSFLFPVHFPIFPDAMSDPRGRLFEGVRAAGGESQVFFSTTRPNQTRGEHFHLRKMERFVVLQGSARISLRRLFDSEIVHFNVSGLRPAIVDMPTKWVHSITNTGESDLVTLFYADQVFNPQDPDTFRQEVHQT